MPLIESFLSNKYSAQQKNIIARDVYDCLRDVLNVKAGAKFVYFKTFSDDDMFVPDELFGIKYSRNLVLLRITLNKGRSQTDKKKLYEKLSVTLAAHLGIAPGDVLVCLMENVAENWSFGEGRMPFLE
ncbi:tautomerase family protein [Affinibrenneria salicis]|uniref:Tautomerase family protein n=1 Tax=Affinibrenneria salicis TaxID=2590031 RepID=A0A5J5FZK1_9GAMM|nr:tautomerase family protein [Affinibrenneria salicis]